ncbi:hypothetical protein KEJ51_05825 [Candidatus Bathyarchaeota archaeon]|nr:hypothetical protein [Candidatus Bathyarchaeota archaeon]MBS7629882.1 hypothetical protein [Candidatus Bathyarchaeota archaeon]
MSERKLRFRIKRGEYEVELEGDFDYVRERFERLLENFPREGEIHVAAPHVPSGSENASRSDLLGGIVEFSDEGKPRLTVPVDSLKAKEALALILYAARPVAVECVELSDLLSSSWKTMKPEAVRARASELRREGLLVADDGRYTLSGAGVQWVESQIIPRLK